MTKKNFFTVVMMGLIALSPISMYAQAISVVSSDYSGATFAFATPELTVNVQEVQGEPYTVVSFQGSVPSTELGAPNLPLFSKLIEIPLCGDVTVRVSHMRFRQLDNLEYRMMPVQPVPSKSDRAPHPFVLDSALYATDGYYELLPATIEKIGVARDRNLARLCISPLAYNPVTGEMLLVTSMTVTVQYEGADAAATERMHSRYHSPDFAIGQDLLAALPESKSVRREAPLHYLIVSHSMFRGALDEFVNWKRSLGMIVTVAYTDDEGVGTTSADIADYIKGYYTHATEELPAPTYLLLVGDHQQIPAFASQLNNPSFADHVTDLYYATWTEGDIIPDCYYGRFSARNLSELTPQIEKTLLYERYAFADDSYLGRGILIAGVDGGRSGDNAYRYADPAMDYMAAYYVNAANGYTDVKYYKNNTTFAPTGVTVTGSSQTNTTASALRNYYNEGCGWINYSAHGYDDEWSSPRFNTSHAQNMTNYGKPSVMIGNCCLSGKFNTTYTDACLGEALLRKGGNAGAVIYIGGTNSTYWPHDFCWSVGVRENISGTMEPAYNASRLGMYDRLFHTHREPFTAWHTTAGSMVMAGNTAVQEYSGGIYSEYYWEIYELFGDPSLMPWLATANNMTVNAAPAINIGTVNYAVTAVPYAYVALIDTVSYELIAAAYADANGQAELTLPTDLMAGEYRLSVVAQNHRPYSQTVSVVVLDGPYVVLTEMVPTSGNLKPGQVATFDIALANIGSQYPTRGIIHLESLTDGIMPVQTEAHFPGIAPGDTLRIAGVCPTYVSESLANGVRVKLSVSVDFGGGNSIRRPQFAVVAPCLSVINPWLGSDLIGDSTSILTFQLVNRGDDTTDNTTISLPNLFGFMTSDAPLQAVGRLAPRDTVALAIPVTMVSSLPHTSIPFCLYANDSCGSRLLETLSYSAGCSEMEDFETGTLTKFNWVQNSNPWEVTSLNPYAGTFSARSKQSLGNYRESRMSISWTSTRDDSISFVYKVSSESGFDKFVFFIDGVEMVSASGEDGWTRVSVPVSAGYHNFGFSYSKDQFTASGSDCAWIDNVRLPFTGEESLFVQDTVCKDGDYSFGSLSIPTDQTGLFNYSDTIDGQMAYLSLLVTEEPQVAIEVIGTPALGGCVLLRATGASSYVWSTGDSAAFISVCPQAVGEEYSVEGCRAGCCATASVTFDQLAINENTQRSSVTLYPNPARDRVTVRAEQMRSVELLSLVGQTLMRREAKSPAVTLDLQRLPKGVYFVRVETEIGVGIEKLVLR